MEGMAADGMDSSFMAIFGEFMEGYTKCAIKAGTTPEQFQSSIGTLIKARTGVCFIGVVTSPATYSGEPRPSVKGRGFRLMEKERSGVVMSRCMCAQSSSLCLLECLEGRRERERERERATFTWFCVGKSAVLVPL